MYREVLLKLILTEWHEFVKKYIAAIDKLGEFVYGIVSVYRAQTRCRTNKFLERIYLTRYAYLYADAS